MLVVDEKSAASLSLNEIRDCWKTIEPGTVVNLQVQDSAGTRREIRLVLRDLV